MTSMSLTMPRLQLRREDAWKQDESAPRIVALDRTRHATPTTTATHELGAPEGDDGTLRVGDATIAREKIHSLYHAKAGAFHFTQRGDVARVGEHQPRPHRDEIAPRRPLLP